MASPVVLFAHPNPDLYGSDLQLLESVQAVHDAGNRCVVVLPESGPLVPKLTEAGAEVEIFNFPVLRRGYLKSWRILLLLSAMATSVFRQVALIKKLKPDLIYVNTVTIPTWGVSARIARTRAITHVHEDENAISRILGLALTAPLLASDQVIANSESTRHTLVSTLPRLESRITVVYNGVADLGPLPAPRLDNPSEVRLTVVGRLTPRKGPDVAVEAVDILRSRGERPRLNLCGSVFPGYEWFEDQLRKQVQSKGLGTSVAFHGYVNPTTDVLADTDIVLMPTLNESFGRVAVEAMLAGRPVIASDLQGLREIIRHGVTGILVPPGDPRALADAIQQLATNPELRSSIVRNAREDAVTRFTSPRYRNRILSVVFPEVAEIAQVSSA